MDELYRKTDRTDAFWRDFGHAHHVDADYDVVVFGNSPAMATELADLVVAGPKRATAGLVRDFEQGAEPLPVVGGYVVLVDGQGSPRAVWQTTEVRIGALSSVDEAFAWDEGEGDRTRNDWLRLHRAYFEAQAKEEGFDFDDSIETVFERFKVVWPRDLADP
ncbi:MAG: ASCH domain-containing protein [Pseudomonadota bacterium]